MSACYLHLHRSATDSPNSLTLHAVSTHTLAMMPARTLVSRSIPILTAATLSVSVYAIHTHRPVLLDASPTESTFGLPKKPRLAITPTISPYVPLGWGSNRYLTLSADKSVGQMKKPAPLSQFGATPLRDLVLAEKYGAAVDAKGDCYMWGVGYDETGAMGRSLRGKVGLGREEC
jgi:hypothetical protein